MLNFPPEFLWGVSTSAHQFEGGSPPSQWVQWERSGGIRSGHSRGCACGWWESVDEDLRLCRDLGLNAIRISLDWARIEPDQHRWNSEAVECYRRLLAKVREYGMRPFVTLHHFTHPQWFESLGAFLNSASPEYFSEFSERIITELQDLCCDWLTFNEPNVYAAFGYVFGDFPPGQRYQLRDCATAFAQMHRAHALAYARIHRIQPHASVGIATNWVEFKAATSSPADRLLAYAYDAAFNRSSLNLLLSGSLQFPFGTWAPVVPEAMQKVDFIGLNVYNRLHVRSPWDEAARRTGGLFVPDDVPQGDRGVDMPYGEAYPAALISAATEYSKLGVPIYITENGVPDREDIIRPWVLKQTIKHAHELIASGIDIRGYFHWSLVDNFEWSEGWTLRFGLYGLDLETQQRIARPSAGLYRQIIAKSKGSTK